MEDQLFDVFAVTIASPRTERFMDGGMTEDNAEAYIKMAVYRRGVDTEFYIKRPSPMRTPVRMVEPTK